MSLSCLKVEDYPNHKGCIFPQLNLVVSSHTVLFAETLRSVPVRFQKAVTPCLIFSGYGEDHGDWTSSMCNSGSILIIIPITSVDVEYISTAQPLVWPRFYSFWTSSISQRPMLCAFWFPCFCNDFIYLCVLIISFSSSLVIILSFCTAQCDACS